jgi:glutaredoxin 3
MPAIDIYTRPMCPYCHGAIALLQKTGVAYTEIEAGFDPQKKQEMIRRANGRTTFPQIFVGGTHVGGCDDLYDLDEQGRLDPLLAGAN